MLHLNRLHLFHIHKAEKAEQLLGPLQLAVELEHSTIPPYLTAMYSLMPGVNDTIKHIIKSIAAEEMLHLTIVGNMMVALGGSPDFRKPDFIPAYPGHLPLGIAGGLTVGLEKFSKDLLKNKFMVIEEPEQPLEMPDGPEGIPDSAHTIGAFYLGLHKKLKHLGLKTLPGNPDLQVVSGFPEDLIFPIITVDDAIRAIEVIIEQGEGTSTSPLDMEGDLAHFYKFEEIYYGRKIEADSTSHCGYGFTGAEIPFDEGAVYPLWPNTRIHDIPHDAPEHHLLKEFNVTYSLLLRELHAAFHGEPRRIENTYRRMGEISQLASRICTTPFPGKEGFNLGLPFEYVAV